MLRQLNQVNPFAAAYAGWMKLADQLDKGEGFHALSLEVLAGVKPDLAKAFALTRLEQSFGVPNALMQVDANGIITRDADGLTNDTTPTFRVDLNAMGKALKAGDNTAEPSAQRNLATTEAPGLDLNKLGNKGLTGMERNLKERLWSGGGMLLTAFFVAGLAYRFRHAPVNRIRWCFALCALALAPPPLLMLDRDLIGHLVRHPARRDLHRRGGRRAAESDFC